MSNILDDNFLSPIFGDFTFGEMDDSNIKNIEKICGEDIDGKVYKLLEFAESNDNIADPWYTRDFETTYLDILKGCKGLLHVLKF